LSAQSINGRDYGLACPNLESPLIMICTLDLEAKGSSTTRFNPAIVFSFRRLSIASGESAKVLALHLNHWIATQHREDAVLESGCRSLDTDG
jgi:hypothetical protein